MKPANRLRLYAEHFDHIEVNSTYYAIPPATVMRSWVQQTPDTFRFEIKLHRIFSQAPATATGKRMLDRLLEATKPLLEAKRLRAFLLVLAPSFDPGRHTLAELDAIVDRVRPNLLAVELRDRAWVVGRQRAATLDYFRRQRLAFVGTDMPRVRGPAILPPLDVVTNPQLAYLRLHGRNRGWLAAKSAAERHAHAYSTAELRAIARRVARLAATARTVCVVANNHARDFAPRAALALKAMLGRRR